MSDFKVILRSLSVLIVGGYALYKVPAYLKLGIATFVLYKLVFVRRNLVAETTSPIEVRGKSGGVSVARPKPDKFSVMTYNTQCMMYFGAQTRAKRIAEEIKSAQRSTLPNVLCLQEMFDKKARDDFIESLDDVYPFSVTQDNDVKTTDITSYISSFFIQNSGLLILSMFPITGAEFLPFRNHIGSDSWARKGCLFAKIDVGLLEDVVVSNTHFQASPDRYPLWWNVRNASSRSAEIRAENASRMMRVLRRLGSCSPLILCGDFNIVEEDFIFHGLGQSAEYASLLETLRGSGDDPCGVRDVFRAVWKDARKYPGFTYDYRQNNTASEGSVGRLDYIFLIDPKQRVRVRSCTVRMMYEGDLRGGNERNRPSVDGSLGDDSPFFEQKEKRSCFSDHFSVIAGFSI